MLESSKTTRRVGGDEREDRRSFEGATELRIAQAARLPAAPSLAGGRRGDAASRALVVEDASRLILADADRPSRDPGLAPEANASTEASQAQAERSKYEFLAMLAHELRNPLAAIINALQLSAVADEDREWAREVIEQQAKHLSRLIDDLLDVSRVSQGKITLRKEPIRLAAVVDRAVEAVRPLMERHRHVLVVTVAPELPQIDADPIRLEQVLGNLLNNAARYTEDGGRITLTARREGREVIVEVQDSGIGIAPELLPRIFELFTQADGTLDRAKGGLGIGLALVRTLTELHGGGVSAASEGLGHGSTFRVRLPAAEAEPEARPHPGTAAIRRSRLPSRVLVVDDNLDIARSMARLLKRAGLEVQAAHDGLDALEAARVQRPEVVLLDIGLPGLDGYQVAERLRRDDGTRKALIIAISGYGQEEDRLRSREAGFDHHLVKPVEFGTLLDLMDRMREREPEPSSC